MEEQWRRHSYRPMRRQMQAVAAVASILLCTLLAVGIYLIGRPPGKMLASVQSKHSPPETSKPQQRLELARLTQEEKQELLQLTFEAFRNLSPEEGQAASLIYGRLSQKQPTTEEQLKLFNTLFQKGVLKLPPERKQRLQQLFARTMPPPTAFP